MKDRLSGIDRVHSHQYYFRLLTAVQELLATGKPAVISIDGRCGSGKTSLAGIIHENFSCNVFHMDDFYLPMDKRKENWERLHGGNMDLERFREEALIPAARGETVMYRPFNCKSGVFGKCEQVQPKMLTVVEGSYSAHPLLAEEYDMRIFLTCSKDKQRERLMEREGENYRSFERRWIPLEEDYFRSYDIESNSDMVLDSSGI